MGDELGTVRVAPGIYLSDFFRVGFILLGCRPRLPDPLIDPATNDRGAGDLLPTGCSLGQADLPILESDADPLLPPRAPVDRPSELRVKLDRILDLFEGFPGVMEAYSWGTRAARRSRSRSLSAQRTISELTELRVQ